MTGQDHDFELTIAYERAENGWLTAIIPSLPGVISVGSTRAKARSNVLDALRTFLAAPGDMGDRETETVRVSLEQAHSRDLGRGI